MEVKKYAFPPRMLEHALFRATFLGFANVVDTLVAVAGTDPNCRSTFKSVRRSGSFSNDRERENTIDNDTTSVAITPLHICALLGHPTVARVLLARGANPKTVTRAQPLIRYFCRGTGYSKGFTPLELAEAVTASVNRNNKNAAFSTAKSAVELVLFGDVCVCCGVLLKRDANDPSNTFLASIFNPSPVQARQRAIEEGVGTHIENKLPFCKACYIRDKKLGLQKLPLNDNGNNGDAYRIGSWQPYRPVQLDQALGPLAWHCRHCKIVLTGNPQSKLHEGVTCKRCFFSYCRVCAYTFRILRSRGNKNYVRVCQNCHHVLRSCPCINPAKEVPETVTLEGGSVEKVAVTEKKKGKPKNVKLNDYMVFCIHVPYDYACRLADAKSGEDGAHCECYQCMHRKYVLHEPIERARIARYADSKTSIATTAEQQAHTKIRRPVLLNEAQASLRGYGVPSNIQGQKKLKDRSGILYCISETYSLLTKHIEEAIAKPSQANGHSEKKGSHQDASSSFRDYETELREFYKQWNPSKLNQVEVLLKKFRGKEKQLLDSLKKSYGIYE